MSKTNQTKKNICIMGASLDSGNRGVGALAASLIQNFHDALPQCKISLLYGNRSSGMEYLQSNGEEIPVHIVNYRLSPRAQYKEHLVWILMAAVLYKLIPIQRVRHRLVKQTPWLKAIEEADVIGDIQGGDSFSDIYGLKRFIIQVLPSFIPSLLNKKLVLLPQTYGPYKSFIARKLAKSLMIRCDTIYSRDQKGLDVVRSLLGSKADGKNIEFCPDVAFTLPKTLPGSIEIKPPFQIFPKPLVGVNVSGLLFQGGYTGKNMFNLKSDYPETIYNLIEYLLDETDANILLTPHVITGGQEDDYHACQKIYDKYHDVSNGRLHMITSNYNPSELKAIIGSCDIFYGSRMHSCIAALSQAIPSIGIAYSPKFKGVYESLGVDEYVIDAREHEKQQIIDRVGNFFTQKKEIAEKLRETIPQIQSAIQRHLYNTVS